MKNNIILMAFLTLLQTVFGQDCEFNPRQIHNQLDYELDTIDEQTFDNAVSLLTDQNTKDIEQVNEEYFLEKYPQIFKIDSMCYTFKTADNNNLKACGLDTTKDMKEQIQYEFKGQYCNSALIYISGYEYWGYLTVDLSDGLTFYTMGEPKTFNCKTALSYSNYYLEEEIAITDMTSKKQVVIGIDGWTTSDFKQTDREFYFKLKSMNNCQDNLKYIKIKIK